MNAAMNNATVGLKPIVFGDDEYFDFKPRKYPTELPTQWGRLSGDSVAYHAGLKGPVDTKRR